jgi:hypothetical protein
MKTLWISKQITEYVMKNWVKEGPSVTKMKAGIMQAGPNVILFNLIKMKIKVKVRI